MPHMPQKRLILVTVTIEDRTYHQPQRMLHLANTAHGAIEEILGIFKSSAIQIQVNIISHNA
jgi:hypothetical protein